MQIYISLKLQLVVTSHFYKLLFYFYILKRVPQKNAGGKERGVRRREGGLRTKERKKAKPNHFQCVRGRRKRQKAQLRIRKHVLKQERQR
jgi:hypothetical protein